MPAILRTTRDALKGLQDRAAFSAQAHKVLHRHPDRDWSGVYLRIQNLSAYGVRHGANAGDEVLRLVARTLDAALSRHRFGRLETGSFVALSPTSEVAGLVDSLNAVLPGQGEPDAVYVKAGYCPLTPGLDVDGAILRARFAYEDIRYDGPVHSRLFDDGLSRAFERRAYVTEHLDDAIARGEIRAYAQPIVRVLTGHVCEVEVLSRWESEEFGFLRPDEFIPELEHAGMIHRLDGEVVRLACKQWALAAAARINVPFGINLSRLDFELTDIYAVVRSAMETYNVPVDQVHIEVTESALSHSSSLLYAGIERFRRAGFMLYLDDFGSGYSSLQVLGGEHFNVVKLDMSLLQEVETNERTRVIVADAVSMVKRLNMQTLCEGVETEEQLRFLQAVGCEKAQGYLFGRPKPHEEIMAHLEETAELHERPEDTRYLDTIGRVNLIDGTHPDVHGVEAAHFLGTQPFAVAEVRGNSVKFLSANAAFTRFVSLLGTSSIEDFSERLSGDLSDVRNKILFSASKAEVTRSVQRFDFVLDGVFCTMGISFVDSTDGRDAYLVEVASFTRYSQFNDFKMLERSLRFLYTIFKRIDLLDVTDQTWRNIYLNVPRYSALREAGSPMDEIAAFAQTFIHPDDRASFLEFYDLATVDTRIATGPTNHLSDTFFTLSDEGRYEDQLFMIIPISLDGHKQYLSCMRDLDNVSMVRQDPSEYGRISDDVLLTGLLEVTDRIVYWKDDKLRYIGANQRYLDFYGFPGVESILGKVDAELGFTNNPHFLPLEQRVVRGETVRGDLGVTHDAAGVRHNIEVSRMPLWSEGKIVGMVGFFRDLGPSEEQPPQA